MPHRLQSEELPRIVRGLRRSDPVLGAHIGRVGACQLRLRAGPPYKALLRSILYQQLAGAAAAAIERRFLALYEGRYPQPEPLLRTRAPTLRKAGLSRQKIAGVRSVAEAFASGRVRGRRLYHMSDDEVIAELTQIRGVGVWTVHMLLMSSLGRADVLPVGDYGVQKGAQLLYGLKELPKPRELEALAEPWAPYRSVASWYLWRHEEMADR